jgi:hypothetical protein
MPRGRAFYERTKGGTGGRDEQKTPNSEVLNLVKLKVVIGHKYPDHQTTF